MRNLLNFALFQAVWFLAVGGAASGSMWAGPAACVVFLGLHLAMIPEGPGRSREFVYVLAVGLVGTLADSLLGALDATNYPTSRSAWPHPIVPPWITSLWVAFAMLPRFSLGWLRGRPGLAVVFGAIGGPLSYLAGTRIGAVAVGEAPMLTWTALSIEYALVTPLLLRFAPAPGPGPRIGRLRPQRSMYRGSFSEVPLR